VAQGGTLSYRFFQDRPAASHIVAELTQASLAVLIFGLLFSVSITLAQKTGRPDRKVIARVQPAYPQILKNARIGGVVRLNATVLANGSVTKVVILGGNPILAESAVQAVMHWKFAAGASPTEEEVILTFDPR
jgi:TonB family protein